MECRMIIDYCRMQQGWNILKGVQDDFGTIIGHRWSMVNQMLNDCSALAEGLYDNFRTTVANIFVNYNTIDAQSLDYCRMIVVFDEKFKKY